MITLTHHQMLAEWRRVLGLAPALTGCTVEIVGGINLEPDISRAMRIWYLAQLDTAPLHLVPHRDIASQATLIRGQQLARVSLPASVRRVVSVRLSGWHAAAAPVAADTAAPRIARLASPFGRPGNAQPLAAFLPEGLAVAPAAPDAVVESLIAVVDPGPETYVLDESLLATIPADLQSVAAAYA